jgi:hypothetical protein
VKRFFNVPVIFTPGEVGTIANRFRQNPLPNEHGSIRKKSINKPVFSMVDNAFRLYFTAVMIADLALYSIGLCQGAGRVLFETMN